MSGAILEARAVIVGQDKTKAAFDSIEARINKLVGRILAIDKVMGRVVQVAAPIDRATTEMAKFNDVGHAMAAVNRQIEAVRKSFVATTESIDKATSAASKFERVRLSPRGSGGMPGAQGEGHRSARGHSRFETLREVTGGLAPMVGLGLAFEGAEAIKGAVKGGFERQHERVRMASSGMSARDIAEAEGLSADLTSRYAPVGQTEIMHMLRNTRSVVGSYGEAAKIIKPLLDLRIVAQGAHPGEDMTEEFDQLVKGMEIKGVTQDPAKFRSYINAMGKAVNAFGDTLRPTDFYEMFKYGRQSTTGFSQDYMMTVAPTLAQEMKGSSAGVANSDFFRAIVGGRMEKGALAHLEELGLVDKSKLFTPKGGHLVSAAGAIKGTELAQINPYEWVNQVLLPAMQKKGIVDPQKVQQTINSIFSNQVAAQMVGIYASQQARIEKDRGVIAGAMDTQQAARQIMERDPTVAAEGLKNAIENLGSIFADKTLHLAGGMTSMAEAINRFSADLQHAYERPNDGKPTKGQEKFNTLASGVVDWWNGWEHGGSSGGYEAGKRASLIATSRRGDANAEALDYDAYENFRNGGRLAHDDANPLAAFIPRFPLDRARLIEGEGELHATARQNRADAAAARAFAQLGRDLDAVDRQIGGAESSAWGRAIGAPPDIAPTVPPGRIAFPHGRSYADIPLPGDMPWNPRPTTPSGSASPAAEEHHGLSAEDLKAAFSAGGFMAQLDPNSKVQVDASFKVEPSSELIKIIDGARSIVASGSASAGAVGTSGSTGISYPQTAPSGRGGGVGRM